MSLRFIAAVALVSSLISPAFAETVLNRGNVAEPGTLDPQKSSTTYENHIQGDLFETLVTNDAAGEYVPGAAASWTVSTDGRIYTFKLRPNLKWSDGTAMTSADFVYGMRRAIDPKTHSWYANMCYNIKNAKDVNEGKMKPDALGVGAPDANTVVVTLIEPSPTLIFLMAHPMLAPAPKHVIDKFGDKWTKPGTLVSNGPYKLAEWRPNDHIKLVRNTYFHDAANVKIDAVKFFPIEDDAAAVKRLRAGEIDANLRFPANELEQLKKTLPAGVVRTSPANATSYLVFNFKKPPFNEPRVRRALSLVVDREAIANKILRNGELPSYSIVSPVAGKYTPVGLDFKGKPLAERQAEARTLLTAAGYGPTKPLKITFDHRVGISNKRVAIAVQDMFKAIGVQTDLAPNEVTAHYARLREGDFSFADAGWYAFGPDPEFFTYLLLSGSTEINYGAYSNSAFDKKSEEGARIMDMTKRMAVFQEAEKIALADNAVIPVYITVNRNLVAPRVKGWVMNPSDGHPTRFMSIDPKAPTKLTGK